MNLTALQILTGDRAKYLGLIFAIAFSTFLLQNQSRIFAGIMKRTASQVRDVTDAGVWVMAPATLYFDETKALRDTDLTRVRSVPGTDYAVRLFKGLPAARTRDGNFHQGIVIGVDDATLIGAPRRMLLGSWERLREPDSLVIDKAGFLLLFGRDQELPLGDTLEINDNLMRIVGISDASAPFTNRAHAGRGGPRQPAQYPPCSGPGTGRRLPLSFGLRTNVRFFSCIRANANERSHS